MKLLLRHHFLSAVVISILSIWVVELLFLEKKYNVFSGGFLQVYVLETWVSRSVFLFTSLVFDVALYGLVALIWYWVAKRIVQQQAYSSYVFLWFTGGVTGGIIGAKYQLFTYFSDAMTFDLAKNLGGGSIQDAVAYAFSEAAVAIYVAFIGLVIFAAGLVYLRHFLNKKLDSPTFSVASSGTDVFVRRLLPLFTILFFIGAVVLAYANSVDELRYNLSRKISYAAVNGILSVATDFDLDGYGALGYPTDRAPFNLNIYPGALDIPNNGIDEDGLFGDFSYDDGGLMPDVVPELPANRKNFVLIVVESGRADVLEKIVDGVVVAPNINQLARTGTVFTHAYSHAGYTVPSLKTMFTGEISGRNDGKNLFAYLKKNGYEISVFSGQDESFGEISSASGMKQHSDRLFDAAAAPEDRVFSSALPGSIRLDEQRVLREVSAHIEQADWNRPQFMYINFQGTHFPYRHPAMTQTIPGRLVSREEILPENRDDVQRTYWNAFAYVDHAIGGVMQALASKHLLERSIVAITADHGESLFDDGYLGHGIALTETQTRIPLIFNVPDMQAREPLGENEFMALFQRALAGSAGTGYEAKLRGVLFQYVGGLDRPSQIGIVEKNEKRTVLDFHKQTVFFSDEKRWLRLGDLSSDGEDHQRVARLVNEWERLRWENNIKPIR